MDHANQAPAPGDDDAFVDVTLAAHPASAAHARAFVAGLWHDLDAGILSDVTLIVSELVTNAVRHGEPEIVLKLRRTPFAIDIAVLDHGQDPPRQRTVDDTAVSGRGLAIIDHLALRWGCDPLDGRAGKAIWACVKTS